MTILNSKSLSEDQSESKKAAKEVSNKQRLKVAAPKTWERVTRDV